MKINKLIEEIINRSKEKLDEAEVYLEREEELSIEIFEGEISKYNLAESGGLSLRGSYRGNMGYAYTEKLDESSIEYLISEVIENSKYIAGDEEVILQGSKGYANLDYIDKLSDFTTEEKIETLKKIEKEALNMDKRIRTNRLVYSESINERQIVNTKGVDLADKQSSGGLYFSVIARDGEDVKTGSSSKLFKSFEEVDQEEISKKAVENAISMLGAQTIRSGDYKLVFEDETFGSLLASFLSVFEADKVQKGLSLLTDKLGEEIASKNVTLVDDPFLKDGFGNRSFDGEGTATRTNKLVEAGKLKGYLYNWKTAKKDELESTGNAGRHYKGSITTTVSNFYLEAGNKSEEELLKIVDQGIFIDSLQGLHSGLDPVSGDFSLSASGYLIKEGRKDRPVNQITVSGNFFDLFKNIEEIGSNLKFGLSSGGRIGSPSVYVKGLSIAGD